MRTRFQQQSDINGSRQTAGDSTHAIRATDPTTRRITVPGVVVLGSGDDFPLVVASVPNNVVPGVIGGVMIYLAWHADDLLSERWSWSLERVDEPVLITSDVLIKTIGSDTVAGGHGYADLPLDQSTVLVFRSGTLSRAFAKSLG